MNSVFDVSFRSQRIHLKGVLIQFRRLIHRLFSDSWQSSGRAEDEQGYTQHGFTGVATNGRIDWILVTPEFRVLDVSVVHDHEAGRYPSDHFPFWVDLELEESG